MICTDCHTVIPAGLAVVRSVSLRTQLAWHRECWQTRPEVFIPQQRAAMNEKVEQ